LFGPGHLICYTVLFNCGPCDNYCYLAHTKNPDDDDDDDGDGMIYVNNNTAAGFVWVVPAVVNSIVAPRAWNAPVVLTRELRRTACYNVISK